MRIANAHVVVTGASRGIGDATARELRRRGARVTAVARSKKPLDDLATEIGVEPFPADLADPSEVDGLVERIESAHGPIDVLVNNAAIGGVGEFTTMPRNALADHVNANLLAPMTLTHAAVPGMLRRGHGSVVMVSSLAGEMATRNATPYSATKAGLSLFARDLQRELRVSPVNVTLVVLGEVDTAILDDVRADPVMAQVAKRIGKLRALTPAAVAHKLAEAIESDRQVVVLPPAAVPLVGLRAIPSRLMDLALRGI